MNDTSFNFHLLVEPPPPLPVRLIREFIVQSKEFSANPQLYMKNSMANDAIGRKRTKLLLFSASFAIILFSIVLLVIIMLRHRPQPVVAGNEDLQMITPIATSDPPKIEMKKAKDRAGGGGGGGRNEPKPASKGALPKATLTPPIVAPTTHDTPIKIPSLPVVATVQVDPRMIPPQPPGPLGLPNGAVGPPSDGPGDGGGIGTGKKGGVGSGNGTGLGPGNGYNTGGGDPRIGGGDGESAPTVGVKLLTFPKPTYTEEARKNKIQGTVTVEVIFKNDGHIVSPRVIRGLGYGLDERAIEAVMEIKFRPAESNGHPVDQRKRVNVSFTLL